MLTRLVHHRGDDGVVGLKKHTRRSARLSSDDDAMDLKRDTKELKKLVASRNEMFNNSRQQDAHEFLYALVDGLHDDLNLNRERPAYEAIVDAPADSPAVRSARWWSSYSARNASCIVDLFAGQLQSTLKCDTCNHCSITYDPVRRFICTCSTYYSFECTTAFGIITDFLACHVHAVCRSLSFGTCHCH